MTRTDPVLLSHWHFAGRVDPDVDVQVDMNDNAQLLSDRGPCHDGLHTSNSDN